MSKQTPPPKKKKKHSYWYLGFIVRFHYCLSLGHLPTKMMGVGGGTVLCYLLLWCNKRNYGLCSAQKSEPQAEARAPEPQVEEEEEEEQIVESDIGKWTVSFTFSLFSGTCVVDRPMTKPFTTRWQITSHPDNKPLATLMTNHSPSWWQIVGQSDDKLLATLMTNYSPFLWQITSHWWQTTCLLLPW